MIAHESDTEPRITQSKDTRHLTNATNELVQKLSTCKRAHQSYCQHQGWRRTLAQAGMRKGWHTQRA